MNQSIKKFGTIYIWINLKNGKKYVGQTIRKLEQRISRHIYNSKNGNQHLYNAIRKYGLENFVIQSIKIPITKLDFAERYLIKICKSMDNRFGYNAESGGNKGKYVNDSTKEKQKLAHIGHLPSKQSIEKQRQKMKGKYKGENNPMYGKFCYNVWIEKYGKEIADEKMKQYLKNRPRGKNHWRYKK